MRTVSAVGDQVADMLDAGFFEMKDYLEGGWVTGLRYESDVLKDLKERTGDTEKPLKKVCPRPCASDPLARIYRLDDYMSNQSSLACLLMLPSVV